MFSFPLSPASLVSLLPDFKQIFCGDSFYLICDNPSDGSVKWYFKNVLQDQKNKTWEIVVADGKDSGSYQCEVNGEMSDPLSITVLGKCTT